MGFDEENLLIVRDVGVILENCPITAVFVVSHIQRSGCQPEKNTLPGGQSRSWSAEQGKNKKR